jgi:hypothetical protein
MSTYPRRKARSCFADSECRFALRRGLHRTHKRVYRLFVHTPSNVASANGKRYRKEGLSRRQRERKRLASEGAGFGELAPSKSGAEPGLRVGRPGSGTASEAAEPVDTYTQVAGGPGRHLDRRRVHGAGAGPGDCRARRPARGSGHGQRARNEQLSWTGGPTNAREAALHRDGQARAELLHRHSFNGRPRHECLNQHWFRSLADASSSTQNNGLNGHSRSKLGSSGTRLHIYRRRKN